MCCLNTPGGALPQERDVDVAGTQPIPELAPVDVPAPQAQHGRSPSPSIMRQLAAPPGTLPNAGEDGFTVYPISVIGEKGSFSERNTYRA
jgi:hypothetical protein